MLRRTVSALALAAAMAAALVFPAFAQRGGAAARKPSTASRHAARVSHKPAPAHRTAAKLTYACPMHSTVKSASAGKCPKCGMALAAVKPGRSQAAAAHKCAMGHDPSKCPMLKTGKCPMMQKGGAEPAAPGAK